MKGVRKVVKRKYPNRSWPQLLTIVCNVCEIEKGKEDYNKNRYTCRKCIGERARENVQKRYVVTETEVVEESEEESVVLYWSDGRCA